MTYDLIDAPALPGPRSKRRFIADGLSAANLACGLAGISCATRGRFEASLLLLLAGAAFDGLDGAAARRWGGTRIGVYADDLADAFSYGIAPAVVLALALGGVEGVVLGVAFAGFTIGRLTYFTLAKGSADPAHFAGAPSTIGGVIAVCAAILFGDQPALTGALVGAACALMVSFDAPYKHLGRAVARHRRAAVATVAPLCGVLLGAGFILWGVEGPVAILLGASLVYGFTPAAKRFAEVVRRRFAAR